jgi:hypothetical protein
MRRPEIEKEMIGWIDVEVLAMDQKHETDRAKHKKCGGIHIGLPIRNAERAIEITCLRCGIEERW